MFPCPLCSTALRPLRKANLCIWGCPSCQGRLATVATLRRALKPGFVDVLWMRARESDTASPLECPGCRRTMRAATVDVADAPLSLDACFGCQFVWFDAEELETAPRPAPPRASEEQRATWMQGRSPAAREAAAKLELELERQRGPVFTTRAKPEQPWKHVIAAFGLPVHVDDQPIATLPLLTWLAALGCVAVSLFLWFHTWPDGRDGAEYLGLVPMKGYFAGRVAIAYLVFHTLTSFFAHADVVHLAVNLYFLLTFGRAAEDALGIGRYALLLFAATAVGMLVHVATTGSPDLPILGASGGISGALVWYALTYPRTRIGLYFGRIARPWPFGLVWWNFSARTWIALWFALQLAGAFLTEGEVSYAAHLGGALVGLLAWFGSRAFGLHGFPSESR